MTPEIWAAIIGAGVVLLGTAMSYIHIIGKLEGEAKETAKQHAAISAKMDLIYERVGNHSARIGQAEYRLQILEAERPNGKAHIQT